MGSSTALQELQDLLEDYGLRRFVKKHLEYLLANTLRHERLGKELMALGVIDDVERRICMERKGNRKRNLEFYNFLVTREASWELLVALHFSNNTHVLKFIGKQLRFIFPLPLEFLPKFEVDLPPGSTGPTTGGGATCKASKKVHWNLASSDDEEDGFNDPDLSLRYWNAIIEETVVLGSAPETFISEDKRM